MTDATIDLLKNSSYVGKMDELIAAVKSGGGATSDVEWDNVKNKPTTIGGYGIIDAKIDNGTITLGNQTITPLTSAPVTSVNNKTGAVTLSAADVSSIPSTLTGTAGQVLTKTADGQEWKDVGIPAKLPNPNALTFTGAVTGIYDGLEPVTVSIPSGGGVELLYTFELDEDDVVITSKSFLITPEIILEKYIEIFVLCDLTFGAGSEESGHFYINGIKFNPAEIKYFRRKENGRSVCLFVADRIGFSSSLFGLVPSRYAFYSGYNADSIDGIGVSKAPNNLAKSGKISSIGFSSSSGFLLSTGSVIKIYGLKLG